MSTCLLLYSCARACVIMTFYKVVKIWSSFLIITEKVKTHLAHAGLCELLVQLLEKHRPLIEDDETRNLLKMACDLIVLVLTGGK
jgi:hypothetical protein